MEIRENNDIIMTKWVAIKGTEILLNKYYDELSARLPVSILEKAKIYCSACDTVIESRILQGFDAVTYKVSDGGIFKALWDMVEAARVGIEINLKSINIKQETIEICECFDINPYMLNGEGSMLIISPEGNTIVRALSAEGIEAGVIGYVTSCNDRVIVNGGEKRYIESRIKDELYKLG